MISRAASLLGIQPGEGRSASLLLLHSFAMGTGTVFFETAASALFLAHFGSSLLPWAYIAAAVLNTFTGIVYSGVQERVRFERLMYATLALLLLFIVTFRIGLWAAETGILVFSMLVFYRVLSALTDLEYWAVATRLYDVRQAKRLFGMIGSGEVVARIVGSFSVAILVGRLGVANLLLVSAAGVAGCLAIVVSLMGAGAAIPGHGARREAKRPAGGLRTLLAGTTGRYLGLLLAITFFAILAKYLVDYAFLERMKARYDAATELASFFGVFSGVTQVLSLLTRLFVSGSVLSRFGIRAGLLVLPLAQIVCTAALVLVGTFGAGSAPVFWLVMMNQGIYKTLKHPIDNPSFKVLYQPLRPEDRLGAQIAVETIITPITTGIAGAVMLLFTVVVPYRPVHFAWVMLLVFAGWVAVALRAGRAYPAALSEALKGRIVDEEFSIDDERSLAVVREALGSERPGDVVFALDLLEKTGHADLLPNLIGLLGHASADVRAAVLARIEARRLRSALEPVARRVEVEDSPQVRAAAVRCLCTLGGPGAVARVVPFLQHADPLVRKAAIVGLLREGGEGVAVAERRVAAFADSRSADERSWAALVLGEAGADSQGLLRRLLEDEAPPVRRAALLAAGKASPEELLPVVVRHLAEPRYSSVAGLALASAGEPVLPGLAAAWLAETRAPVLERIARLWGRIGGPRATALLAEQLRFREERVRHVVLESLRQCGYRAPEGDGEEVIHGAVEAEAGDAAWTTAALRDLEADGRLLLVRSALERELAANRQRIFLLLSFLHDPTAILRARDHLADASKEKRAYALEILDVSLSRETKELVFPLFEDLGLAERCARLAERFPQQRMETEARLRRVLARPEEWLTPWTRACAIYSVGILGIGKLVEELWAARDGAGDALVRETATWALVRLGRAPVGVSTSSTGRRAMLTIEKVITLKAVPMFARTSEEVLADIAAILEEIEVKAGETIFEKGEVGDSLYIIVEGLVRVFDGDHTITRLGERDIFGELALLDPEPRVASIAAVEDTRLFRLDREAFSELMAGNIEIVRGVLSVLCERLRKQAS